jgi:hypothetical protein
MSPLGIRPAMLIRAECLRGQDWRTKARQAAALASPVQRSGSGQAQKATTKADPVTYADDAGVRGIEHRVHGPDGSVAPWST